jgi:hypothetical protein
MTDAVPIDGTQNARAYLALQHVQQHGRYCRRFQGNVTTKRCPCGKSREVYCAECKWLLISMTDVGNQPCECLQPGTRI